MSQLTRYQLWVVGTACLIFFTNLGAAGLFDMDEALYSTCAREMLDRHNLIVPWFNGEMFPEKPPLMFWTMIAGFELFGVNEFGARFFSALLGVGTALAAFHLGRILFNLRVGLWTGLITASTIIFTISARAATVDSALTFFTTMAFLLFIMGWMKSSGIGGQGSENRESSNLQISKSSNLKIPPFPWLYAIATYACIGVTVLGKGPVGMLPLAAMGLFLLAIHGWRSLFQSAWWMRPFTAIVVIAIVAVPWYVAVGYQTNWDWPKQFFLEFNLRPFQKPILGHGDTSSFDRALAALVSLLYYFYQIPAVLVGFFPWSVFLGPTLVDAIWRLKEGKKANERAAVGETDEITFEARRGRIGVVLALCWFGTWFVFWSICKTKLPHYLLPAYPALALLTACFVDHWLSAKMPTQKGAEQFPPPWALRNAWISTILVGIGIMIAIPIVAAKYMPGEESLGQLGLLLILGGGWCWWKTSLGQSRKAAITFAVTSVAFLTAIFGFAVVHVDRFQNAKPMMAAICADEEKGSGVFSSHPTSPIATYRFFRESTVFYSGKPVTRCDNNEATGQTAEQALSKFLAKPGRSYIITTNEYEAEIRNAFAKQVKAIYREQRFLADGEMVVFRHGKQ